MVTTTPQCAAPAPSSEPETSPRGGFSPASSTPPGEIAGGVWEHAALRLSYLWVVFSRYIAACARLLL
jgi:hypothetical protein